jgi:flagellar hook-length control protein FliK
MLARELHQNLNGDIVRHASILLKDGGEGLIRLSLRPESLGNVKIRLEMAENKVTGHIVVESDEALRAFEREIHSLEQAFRDSGFEGANLDIAYAPAGGQDAQGRRWKEEEASPLLLNRLAASGYDTAGDSLVSGISGPNADPYGQGQVRINLLV